MLHQSWLSLAHVQTNKTPQRAAPKLAKLCPRRLSHPPAGRQQPQHQCLASLKALRSLVFCHEDMTQQQGGQRDKLLGPVAATRLRISFGGCARHSRHGVRIACGGCQLAVASIVAVGFQVPLWCCRRVARARIRCQLHRAVLALTLVGRGLAWVNLRLDVQPPTPLVIVVEGRVQDHHQILKLHIKLDNAACPEIAEVIAVGVKGASIEERLDVGDLA
mmetsp:Transcript_55631/g.107321  ORF Transcript_55631/g.107321 Transcript_55631/m.107321 type:complete len:219 (-) Transcript_55631:1119-1775(-)